jgi:anti-sigma factor ChrR (cupin superfamily)
MTAGNHTDEETLERYSMGQLSECDSTPLEEHLLICQACRDRLEFLDTYHQSIRAASNAVSNGNCAKLCKRRQNTRFLSSAGNN